MMKFVQKRVRLCRKLLTTQRVQVELRSQKRMCIAMWKSALYSGRH